MKGIAVRWCMNEACSLFGQECHENECTRCGEKPTRLVWTLIVCEPRGIFMGLVAWPKGEIPKAITAYTCRACVYYPGTGSHGLATVGPQVGARITGAVEEILLQAPKSLAAVSPEALSKWEDEPWSK